MKGSHIQVLQFGNDLSNYNKNNDKIKKKNLGAVKKKSTTAKCIFKTITRSKWNSQKTKFPNHK